MAYLMNGYTAVTVILVVLNTLGVDSVVRDDIVQSSTYNRDTEDLALDQDMDTCSRTGFDIGAWWKYDLREVKEVTGVTLSGKVDAFQVRVGNETDNLGFKGGFENNPLCLFNTGIETSIAGSVNLDCRRARVGRYLSIHVVDPAKYSQLRLCEVTVHAL